MLLYYHVNSFVECTLTSKWSFNHVRVPETRSVVFSSIYYLRWTVFVTSQLFQKWKLLLSVDVFFLTGSAITDRFTRLPATISLQQESNRYHNIPYYDRSFATRQHSRIPLVIKFLRQSTFRLLSGYNTDMLLMFLIMTGEEKNTLWRNTSNVVSTANYRLTQCWAQNKTSFSSWKYD